MKSCCLCSITQSSNGRKEWDEPLYSSTNFVALPSLGAIVEGWLLIVPKQHLISIGAMPESIEEEFLSFKDSIARDLLSKYGPICAFEHGPSHFGRKVGCGVDHAHLHLVPVKFDVLSAAMPFLPPTIEWSIADLGTCRSALIQGHDYLYLEQPLGYGRIAVHDKFESQIFRKAIASRLGVVNQHDWRNYPQHENIVRTISRLKISEAA